MEASHSWMWFAGGHLSASSLHVHEAPRHGPSGRRWKADGMATTILSAPSQSSRVAQPNLMSAIRCIRRRGPSRIAKEAVGGMSGMVIAGRPPGDVGSACCYRITSVKCSCSAASPIQSSLVRRHHHHRRRIRIRSRLEAGMPA